MRYQAVLRPARGAERNSLGGHAFLPVDVAWPTHDGAPMVLFFQFDVLAEYGLHLAPGSHVLAFMSATMNEIPTFNFIGSGDEVPARFWENQLQHFRVLVFGPEIPLVPSAEPDRYLEHHAFDLVAKDELAGAFLFVGGEPVWYQGDEQHPGFHFIGQLSEDYPFPKQASAPAQPSSFSKQAYCLFLGNSVYLFARPAPTDPREVWVVVQN